MQLILYQLIRFKICRSCKATLELLEKEPESDRKNMVDYGTDRDTKKYNVYCLWTYTIFLKIYPGTPGGNG